MFNVCHGPLKNKYIYFLANHCLKETGKLLNWCYYPTGVMILAKRHWCWQSIHTLLVTATQVKHALLVFITLARFFVIVGLLLVWRGTTWSLTLTLVLLSSSLKLTPVMHGHIIHTGKAPELSNNLSNIWKRLKSFLGLVSDIKSREQPACQEEII